MQHWSSEAQTSSSWRQLAVAQIRLTQTPSAQSLVVAHFPPFALGRQKPSRQVPQQSADLLHSAMAGRHAEGGGGGGGGGVSPPVVPAEPPPAHPQNMTAKTKPRDPRVCRMVNPPAAHDTRTVTLEPMTSSAAPAPHPQLTTSEHSGQGQTT